MNAVACKSPMKYENPIVIGIEKVTEKNIFLLKGAETTEYELKLNR